jgi:hypothetical protein
MRVHIYNTNTINVHMYVHACTMYLHPFVIVSSFFPLFFTCLTLLLQTAGPTPVPPSCSTGWRQAYLNTALSSEVYYMYAWSYISALSLSMCKNKFLLYLPLIFLAFLSLRFSPFLIIMNYSKTCRYRRARERCPQPSMASRSPTKMNLPPLLPQKVKARQPSHSFLPFPPSSLFS